MPHGWPGAHGLAHRAASRGNVKIRLPSPQLLAPPYSSRGGVRTLNFARPVIPRVTAGGGAYGFAPTAGLFLSFFLSSGRKTEWEISVPTLILYEDSCNFHVRVHGNLSVSIRLAFSYDCGSA